MIIERRTEKSNSHKLYPITQRSKMVQRDVMFGRFAYIITNILCMTPFYDFQKHTLAYPRLNQIYALIYGFGMSAVFVTALLRRGYSNYTNMFDKFLSIFSKAVTIFLATFLILGRMIFQQKMAATYIRKINAMQYLLGWNYEYEATTFYYVQFIVGHIIFIALMSYNWYVDTMGSGSCYFSLSALSALISEYYCFLSTLQISNQILLIGCRYEMLNRFLVKQLENPLEISEKQIVVNVLDIGRHYRAAAELVDIFNGLFGWVIILIFWHSVIQLLRFSNLFLMLKHDPKMFWMIFASVLISFLISMAESVYIIWSCDNSSSTGKRMVKLCKKLQGKFADDSKPRIELFRLANIAESYKPKFTAANFFVIKKGTLLSLINIATTYLIVIVQFNGALQE